MNTILIKKNKARGKTLPGLTILQSYNNQNSMDLMQKQIYGSMEQNRKSRNKPPHLASHNI